MLDNKIPRNITEWEEYLNNINPNIIKLGLERVKTAAQRLGVDTFPNTKIISVAGTNGKGSTATMLSSILETAGIRTGLYTSPHILRFSERIIYGGVHASDDDLCLAFEEVYKVQQEDCQLTFFEFTTLAALYIFKERGCEVLILEVGLGGRLDATNILDADIVIIPSIGLDHCALLGDTIAKIATEKAGIIKNNTSAIIVGELDKEAMDVISGHAYAARSVIHQLGKSIKITRTSETTFDFDAPIQVKNVEVPTLPLINAPLSVAAALLLRVAYKFDIRDDDIRIGIKNAVLHGRLEQINKNPSVIVDVAHNPPAAAYLNSCLARRNMCKRYAIIGMLKDKDIGNTLINVAYSFDRIYAVSLPGERGADKRVIYDALCSIGYSESNIACFDNVIDAYELALVELPNNAELVVFGSFLTVERVLDYEVRHKHSNKRV